MKVLNRSIVIAGALLVLVGVQTASAQIETEVEFTTTFPFTVANAKLPAGTYTLRPDDIDPQMLEISAPHVGLFFLTERTESIVPTKKTELIFNRYGDEYVLKNVWVAGSEVGYETESAPRARRAATKGPSSEHRVSAAATPSSR